MKTAHLKYTTVMKIFFLISNISLIISLVSALQNYQIVTLKICLHKRRDENSKCNQNTILVNLKAYLSNTWGKE